MKQRAFRLMTAALLIFPTLVGAEVELHRKLSDAEISTVLQEASPNRSLCRCDCTDGQDGGAVERRDLYGSWSYDACNAKIGDSCTLSDGSLGTLRACWRPTNVQSTREQTSVR